MRARGGEEGAKALRNATEDFFMLTPDERKRIKNPGAWITERYMRGFDKLKALHNAAKVAAVSLIALPSVHF
jgi:hypothetical protein